MIKENRRSFTLVEISIVMAILTTLLYCLFIAFKGGMESWTKAEESLKGYQNARAAIAQMSRDIEKAMVNDWGNMYRNDFVGFDEALKSNWCADSQKDEIFFMASIEDPDAGTNIGGDGGLCEMGYWLNSAKQLMRFYVTDGSGNFNHQFSSGSSDQLAEGITDLQIRYYDGSAWQDDWDSRSGAEKGTLPECVKITIETATGKSFRNNIYMRNQ